MVTIHSSPLLPFYHVVLNFRSLYVFCHQFKGLNCFSPQISGHIVHSGSYRFLVAVETPLLSVLECWHVSQDVCGEGVLKSGDSASALELAIACRDAFCGDGAASTLSAALRGTTFINVYSINF